MPTTKRMLPYLASSVTAVMGVYIIALLTGTDFSDVDAPPALFSPIPAWLFAIYSLSAAAAMFPLFIVSLKLPRPRLVAVLGILAGLAVMTPAPFTVTTDFLTILWLTIAHVACVTPLLALAWTLPSRKSSTIPMNERISH